MVPSPLPIRYGRGLLAPLVARLDQYLVVARPEHWERLKPHLARRPRLIVPPGEMTESHLDALLRIVPEVEAAIGIGGSAALDTAKWLHHRRSTPVYLMPSLPSVNACFTRFITLVDPEGLVYSQGAAVPDEVLVDLDLLWSAPPQLLRAGVGDVAACHTACFDWRLASDAGHGPAFDPLAADRARSCVEELGALAPALVAGRDEGLRRLMECRRLLGWQRDALGHSRFEEGSEHAFALAVEEETGRELNHGELVALGVVLFAAIQGNAPELIRRIVAATGVRATPAALGLTWPQVAGALRRLPALAAERRLPPSAASDLDLGPATLSLAREAVEAV